MRRKFAVVAGVAFALGLVAGVAAEKKGLLGYRSYQDCVMHKAEDAGTNARFLGEIIVSLCKKYPNV